MQVDFSIEIDVEIASLTGFDPRDLAERKAMAPLAAGRTCPSDFMCSLSIFIQKLKQAIIIKPAR